MKFGVHAGVDRLCFPDRAWIVTCFSGRRESVRGSNACVRRVTMEGHPGLARRGTAQRNAADKTSGPSLSCFAQKVGDLPSVANPARRIRRALFCTPSKISKAIHL